MDIFDRRYFVLNKALLRSTGLWPYEDRRKKLYIRTFVNLILGICVIFPQIVRIYNYFGVNMNMVLEHAAVLMYITSIYLKFLTSVYYEEKLRVVYDNIAKNWQVIKDENEINILIQYSENGRLLTIGYTIPVLLDVFNPLNQTRSRFYILGGEYFIINNVEDYGKVYAFDCLAVIVTVWLISAVDSMYAASIEHCLGLFAIVKLRLQTCTRSICDGQKDECYKMIVRLIRMHKDIINFTDILESSYSSSFLILVGINVIFLSFECIIVLTRFGQAMEMMRYSMIMVGIVVHLFYISWPGQKLIDFSLGLFQDAYLNEWYTCPTRAQKLLGLMTLRCSKPCQLTAGGMYVMNFSNFAKIVKTSMSYMTVLASFR
ncbi:odorant receptor 137 isoform X2 [Nasonia vitripennis]|uniref:Odorant receptor n=1 Tax=Nasonia vitripennis TaxID=7425 RepID=A0A7M7PXB0_NASVI|nr:odorant receptor 137 isoform X2 [Nasonia vitripennis]